MVDNSYREMTDDKLYELSLQKDKHGRYTKEATSAYIERQRRSGYIQYGGVATRCSKYQNDIDYYGFCEVSNR